MKKKKIPNLRNKENVKPNVDSKDIEFKDPIFEAFKTESQMTDTMINWIKNHIWFVGKKGAKSII